MSTETSPAVEDLGAPPDSWEVADLDASMHRLMLSSSNKDSSLSSSSSAPAINNQSELSNSAASSISRSGSGVSEDVINSVDQFLREAIQNPRERLSVLRMEQEIEKFIKDPTRTQMEFQQLPTSYLRLAAHRVAQHYSLQSMVLMDNSIPDGSGSKIIVCKSSEHRVPPIRLADIPVNLLTDETNAGNVKVAIKQRQKGSQNSNMSNSHLSRTNSCKSVEERKEEYSRARARIFNSEGTNGKAESGSRTTQERENVEVVSSQVVVTKSEEKSIQSNQYDMNTMRSVVVEPSAGSSSSRPTVRSRPENMNNNNNNNNRVAIFRDRDYDRKDPDYDRSYDRYTQRFDPGYGYNNQPYMIQPMYAPTLTYNTEFPQLGPVYHHHVHPHPHQQRGISGGHQWGSGGYPIQETILTPYSPNHIGVGVGVGGRYLHPPPPPPVQYHHPVMPFVHPHEQIHHHPVFLQSHQQQTDPTFGLARPQ